MNKYLSFIFGLEGFLEDTLNSQECIRGIKERMVNREENFLKTLKKCIYEYHKSPYLKLLKAAKIDYEGVKSSVATSGIEGALQLLENEGIYLSLDEVKGRKDTVRKNLRVRFNESDFNNPFTSPAFYIRSGGTMSRGTGTRTDINFRFLADRAQHRRIMFDLHRLFDGPLIVWYPTVGGVEMGILLECAKIGKPPLFFFYQIGNKLRKPSFVAKAAFTYLKYIAGKKALGLPCPELLTSEQTNKILDCIYKIRENYPACCVRTFVSSAVRICNLAKANNKRLEGVKFWVSGEPLTKGKLTEITSTGANAICQYSFGESAGTVSVGCLNPMAADDTHLLKDLFAVIQHKAKVSLPDIDFDAFLFTSLHPQAPKILLNVENGDYGIVENRKCGCGLGGLGLNTHLYNIRSFEKFNAGGMTIFGCDLIKIIEDALVPKYGGSSIDYQFIEEQDNCSTRTTLIISPHLGNIDEEDLLSTIYQGLSSLGPAYRTQAAIWQQAEALKIKRAPPIPNKKGKVFPVRIESYV